MLSVVKTAIVAAFLLAVNQAEARDINLLVIGDRMAANCHAHSYASVPGVFVLGKDGHERPAADPLEWSDCKSGSIWMPLAARIKNEPGVDKVVLVPVALADLKTWDWLNGPATPRLNLALEQAKTQGIQFDYALWQQELSDPRVSAGTYMSQVRAAMKSLSLTVNIGKWLIAETGSSAEKSIVPLKKAQLVVSQQPLLNRFAGPSDQGLAASEMRPDGTLTAAGQEKMAKRWFEAIQRADGDSDESQRESLLFYFR
jgi:hypothetical protein